MCMLDVQGSTVFEEISHHDAVFRCQGGPKHASHPVSIYLEACDIRLAELSAYSLTRQSN